MTDLAGQKRLEELRTRAEEAVADVRRPARPSVSRQEFDRVVHELHVHQLELELQNEELRRAQAELIEARDRYFDFYHVAPVGYVTLDSHWRIVESNVTAAKWLGVERAGLIGKFLSRYLVESEAGPFHLFKREVEESHQPGRFQGWFRRADGEALWTLEAVPEANGPGYRCVLVDLTNHREMESKLQDRETKLAQTAVRLSQIAEHVDDVFYTLSPDEGRPVFVSAAFGRMFGQPPSDVGCGWSEWIHLEDQPRVMAAQERAREGHSYDEEYRVRRADGTWRLIRDRCYPTTGEPEIAGVLHDVTDERALQDELRRAQRLESLGTLASGVAHDFNNLIMGIAGYAHLALQVLEPSHPAYGYIYRSLGSTMRGASLTRQLVSFGDRRGHDGKVMPIDRVVRGAADLLSRLVGDHINVEVKLHAGDAYVPGDAGELEQVLMNLAGNARDAMPEGGTLTIETHVEPGPEGAPSFVTMSVKDTGCGMSRETLDRIFEPFFTTKDVGRGTGLGLATVFSVIRRLGGDLSATSEIGHGTQFLFKLPLAEVQEQPAPTWESLPRGGNGETILVVDDDPLVRATVQSYLQTLGYRVLLCGDADEAVRTCRDHSGSVELMLTDIMMPGRLGGDLAVMLRETCKDLRVLFMSAHPPADLHRLGRIDPGAALLTKPFDMKTLGLAVHKLLQEPVAESSRPADTAVAAEPKMGNEVAAKRIMIVDDDLDVAESLRLFLEFSGQEATVANSGPQALELANTFVPELILCDLNLGSGMNGYEVARALRQVHAGRACYVVALTGSDAAAIRDKATAAGFDMVLTKPVDLSRLHQIVGLDNSA